MSVNYASFALFVRSVKYVDLSNYMIGEKCSCLDEHYYR